MKYLLVILLSLLSFNVSAQKKHKKQFTDGLFYIGKPSVEITYGLTKESIKEIDTYNREFGIAELKLGYFFTRKTKFSPYINRLRNIFLFGQYISPAIKLKNSVSDSDPVWKYGIGSSEGYGYFRDKTSAYNLSISNALTWNHLPEYYFGLVTIDYLNDNVPDLRTFTDELRFGNMTEAVISIPIVKGLNINAEYERSLIYSRHLFWKWAGSIILEAGAQSAVDAFVKAIMRSSPSAGPIMNFLLKNGLSYGIYELRKSKMNWPFNSEAPLLYDAFKIGVNVVF